MGRARFSPQIHKFLKSVGSDPARDISIVPKSDSAGSPGDVLFFRYKLGIGPGSRAERIFMLVEPITKDAATGNLLLTGFKVPDEGDYSPESLDSLYKEKALPKENYRTYIMSNIWGVLRRINKTQPEVR